MARSYSRDDRPSCPLVLAAVMDVAVTVVALMINSPAALRDYPAPASSIKWKQMEQEE